MFIRLSRQSMPPFTGKSVRPNPEVHHVDVSRGGLFAVLSQIQRFGFVPAGMRGLPLDLRSARTHTRAVSHYERPEGLVGNVNFDPPHRQTRCGFETQRIIHTLPAAHLSMGQSRLHRLTGRPHLSFRPRCKFALTALDSIESGEKTRALERLPNPLSTKEVANHALGRETLVPTRCLIPCTASLTGGAGAGL
jgi:hypothetical protein